jgi:hypothetical protein
MATQATFGQRAGATVLRLAAVGALAAVILIGLNAGSAQGQRMDGGSSCTFGDTTDISWTTFCSGGGGGGSSGTPGGGSPGGGLPGGGSPDGGWLGAGPDGGTPKPTPKPKPECGEVCKRLAVIKCTIAHPDAFRDTDDFDDPENPITPLEKLAAQRAYARCVEEEKAKGGT